MFFALKKTKLNVQYTTSVKELGISVMGSDIAMKRNSMSQKNKSCQFLLLFGANESD